MWQDYVIFLCSLSFAPALFFTIWRGGGRAIPLTTSIPTALALIGIAVAMSSLGLALSPIVTLITAGTWTILAEQRIKDA